MDPLTALRDFTIRGELDKIVPSSGGDVLHFAGDYSFPASAATAFRSKQGTLYTLETLLFFVRHHHLRHTDYILSSSHHRIPAVTLPDRKPLLDYLLGHTASSDAIEFLPPPGPAADTAAVEECRPDEPALFNPAEAPAAPDRVVDYVSMIRSLRESLFGTETCTPCKAPP